MATTYTYTTSQFNGYFIDLGKLKTLIADAGLSTHVSSSRTDTNVYFTFSAALSGGEQTTLDGVVAAYTYTGYSLLSSTNAVTVSNKSLRTGSTYIVDDSTPSKRINFSTSSSTSTLTLTSLASAARAITFPDITDTVVTLNASQLLTNKSFNQLTVTTGTTSVQDLSVATTSTHTGLATFNGGISVSSGGISVTNGQTVNVGSSGTTSPLNVFGILTVAGLSKCDGGATVATGQTLNVGLTGTSSPCNVFGNLTVAGTSSLQAVTVGTTLGVTGASTFTGLSTFNGGLTIGAGVIKTLDGSAAAPTYSFTNSTNSGMYLVTAGNPAITAGGTKAIDFTSATTKVSNALTVSGAATFTSLATFNGGATLSNGQTLNVGTSGTTSPCNVFGALTANSSATVATTLGVTGATTLSSTLGVTGATTLSSTLGVTGATTLSSTLGVTGASTFTGLSTFNGGLTIGSGVLMTPDGSAAAPTYSFTNSTNSGMYLVAVGNPAITAGGTKAIDFTSAATSIATTLGVTGAATLSSTLGVTGTSTFTGLATFNGGATLSNGQTLNVGTSGTTSPCNIFGNLTVAGTSNLQATSIATTLGVTGAATLSSTLAVTGTSTFTGLATFNGGLTVGASVIKTIDGTAAAPSHSFTNSTNSGMYLVAVGNPAITAGGTKAIDFTTTTTSIATTLAVTGATTLSSTSTHTGLATFNGGATLSNGQTLNVGTSGTTSPCNVFGALTVAGSSSLQATTIATTLGVTGAATLSSTLAVTGTSTFTGLSTFNGGLTVGAGVIKTPDGSAAAPSHSFTNSTNSGMYLVAVGNPAITAGGTKAVDCTTTTTTVSNALSVTGATTLNSTVTIPTGAVNKYVLTSNGSGVATWANLNNAAGVLTVVNVESQVAFSTTSTSGAAPGIILTATPTVSGTYFCQGISPLSISNASRTIRLCLTFNGIYDATAVTIINKASTSETNTTIITHTFVCNGTTDYVSFGAFASNTATISTVVGSLSTLTCIRISA
jgi:collagen type VII alpha